VPRLLAIAVLAVAASGVCLPDGSARSGGGTADLEMITGAGHGNVSLIAGQPFSLFMSVYNHGPDASSFSIHIKVPAGVTYRAGPPDPCSGASDLTCLPGSAAPLGDVFGGDVGSFQAATAGVYTFVFSLTDLGATDPNPANNEASFTATVAAAAPTLAVADFRVTPTHPRAGRTFLVSFRLRDSATGKDEAPSATRCRASVGRTRARISGARAICSVTTKVSARGRVDVGVLTATAAGHSLSRNFTTRLR
jgi:hypothetical protein